MGTIKTINKSRRISLTSNLSKVLKYDKHFNQKKKGGGADFGGIFFQSFLITHSYPYSYKYSEFKFQLYRADRTEGLQIGANEIFTFKSFFTWMLQHRKRSYLYMRIFTVTAHKEAKTYIIDY